MLEKLHAKVSSIDCMTNLPVYAKFFKDVLSERRRLEQVKMVELSEDGCALVKNELPKKLDDPGKFAIPCVIGKIQFKHALCDLGASLSLMPKSVFDRIGLGELKPTKIQLQLADQSVKIPLGIVENLPIRIGKYYVPIDFVVVDMEENSNIPLILGRSFLNTARAVIDVYEGTISFKIGEETIKFRVFEKL